MFLVQTLPEETRDVKPVLPSLDARVACTGGSRGGSLVERVHPRDQSMGLSAPCSVSQARLAPALQAAAWSGAQSPAAGVLPVA